MSREFYAQRIAKVVRHIAENLNGDLSSTSLSRIAGFSEFHFQRQFRAFTGVTPVHLVKLLRLKHASYQLLVDSDSRIIDVALDAGFEAPESFCRAFRRAQGQSPTAFRAEADWKRWSEVFCEDLVDASWSEQRPVRIEEFPETNVAVLEHRGDPVGLMGSVQRFIAWRKASGQCPNETSMTLGIAYNDPAAVPAEEFRFGICASTQEPVRENDCGVVEQTIPGGLCAVSTHVGSTATLGQSVLRLYQQWLPESGATLRDFPCFIHYKSRSPAVPEHLQTSDIHLPLFDA